ncbi:hypothetical protein BLA29_007692, partial [Euroglyphus maynei]
MFARGLIPNTTGTGCTIANDNRGCTGRGRGGGHHYHPHHSQQNQSGGFFTSNGTGSIGISGGSNIGSSNIVENNRVILNVG